MIVLEQQHILNAKSLSCVTSWAIPCAAPVLSGYAVQEKLERFTSFTNISIRSLTLNSDICTDILSLLSLLFSPFLIHDGGTRAKYF